ncbi:MAG: lipoprotein [Candidatus Thiodiazotropha sp. (ex Lucinoma borealis)]|nr:lipoprotein [Candidatus Thiodiazotropha sp. (ex Lucinoma borealis)]MCU7857278.1 lipoprotein [Candidatus Thiodiazotropha sp. (ex Lucinoma borealis)]MCU7867485.1 lipoprotein [Candidatus Thiodiazotropha sp. (ex Lucinoma borealis)]MCU7873288.1 lipoprotein [Candidatus Thiodiazotropha sp. (ex Lucinoma borealis)]
MLYKTYIFILIACCLFIFGCGQKGPLYPAPSNKSSNLAVEVNH